MSLTHYFAQLGSRVLMTDTALCPVPLDGREIANRKAQDSVLLGLFRCLHWGMWLALVFLSHSQCFLLFPFSLKDDL